MSAIFGNSHMATDCLFQSSDFILKTGMSWCDADWPDINVGHSNLYFTIQWFIILPFYVPLKSVISALKIQVTAVILRKICLIYFHVCVSTLTAMMVCWG